MPKVLDYLMTKQGFSYTPKETVEYENWVKHLEKYFSDMPRVEVTLTKEV